MKNLRTSSLPHFAWNEITQNFFHLLIPYSLQIIYLKHIIAYVNSIGKCILR
ncbi:Uncharacterized protein dnm_054900 [Desulfonema magnum]|uniref:Uncharacterized protein n=1 Tax=Desulfonema magnum TaxID=45655 RepID=A0A975BPQ4_9BACT|nr:Uncharacterized protein dnm_054900 [Desulfonema magnum]